MKVKKNRNGLPFLWIVWVTLLALLFTSRDGTPPVEAATNTTTANNIILFIGDGMGPEHVKAGGMFANGAAGSLVFEGFPNQTTQTHNNASNQTTDSAASATAMATGVKVNNGVISVRLPGNGNELQTQLEVYKALGKSTGLVSTSYITDATPAGFGAHETSRSRKTQIFDDYINQTKPTVFLGGGGSGFDATAAQGQGYVVVTDRSSLLGLDTESAGTVAGGFGGGEIPAEGMAGRSGTLPTLPEMTETALNILDNDPDGFFLVVEHEGSDNYSHAGNSEGMVRSVKELAAAVQKAVDWQASHPDTIILVTADHETGDLTVIEQTPEKDEVPQLDWGSGGHTQTPVPVYATGVGAAQITGVQIDNTDIFDILGPTPPVDLLDWIWSGAVTTESAVVNARVQSSSDDVSLLVSQNNDLSSAVTYGPLSANSGNNNTVSFNLSGMASDTQYHYAVKIGDEVDDLNRGTFQTFPAGPATFTFAISGDAFQGSNMPVYDAVREEQARFFISPGDFMYSDIGDADSLDQYRSAFADSLSASRQSELYRSLPIAYTWDDHDYATNDSNKNAPSRSSARQAYQEIVPHYALGALSAEGLNSPLVVGFDDVPIYQSFTVGRAYFIMTDLRSERDPAGNTYDANRSMMGKAQKAWFKEQLAQARNERYTPIFWISSVPWKAEAQNNADHWGGYHAERVEIANFIADKDIQNLVILAADAHMLALDDGSDSNYATEGETVIPVFQAAALNQTGPVKGGPYNQGAYPNPSADYGQYALVQVTENGDGTVGVNYIGKRLPPENTVDSALAANAVADTTTLIDWSVSMQVPGPTAVTLHDFTAVSEGTAAAPVGLMILVGFGLTGSTLQGVRKRRSDSGR